MDHIKWYAKRDLETARWRLKHRLVVGSKIFIGFKRYTIVGVIGSGSESIIYKVKDSSGSVFAYASVIKQIGSNAISSFAFLRSLGLETPTIFGAPFFRSGHLREYVQGVTYEGLLEAAEEGKIRSSVVSDFGYLNTMFALKPKFAGRYVAPKYETNLMYDLSNDRLVIIDSK